MALEVQGLFFNPSFNSYVEIPDSANKFWSDELTVMAWVYKTHSVHYFRPIVSKHYTQWEMNDYYNRLRLEVYLTDGPLRAQTAPLLVAGNKYCVACTWRADDGIIRCYIDGEEQSVTYVDTQRSGVMNKNTYNVWVGARPSGVSYSGMIWNVLWYEVELSPDEIYWNFKNPNDPIDDGLILWLPFTENMGVIAKDRSDYGNHARLHNCRWVCKQRRGMYFDNGGIRFDSGLDIDCNYCSVVAVFAIETLERGGTIFTGRNCVVKPSGDKLMLYNSHANKKLIFTNYDGAWKGVETNIDLEAGQIYTGVGIMNNNEEHLYLASNGIIIDHNSRDDLGDCGEYTNSPVYVGGRHDGLYPLHGEVLATMIYNRPISEDEIRQISEINGWFDPPREGLISWILFDGLKEGDTPVDLITGAEGVSIGTPRFVIKKPIRVLRL